MALSHLVTELQIDDVVFGSTVKPPGSANTLFLGGAGVRALQTPDRFIKVTAIGVYMEEHAVPSLAVKWKGKSADELTDSVDFFMDIFAGPFEKFTRVTMIMPLGGAQYAEKVSENCVACMKSLGKYGEAEAQGVEKLVQAFKDESFSPGSSILFTHSPSAGTLTIRFSEDGSVPEKGNAVIENKAVSEAVLNSIIGENGVSPDAKRSLALRLCELMKESKCNGEAAEQV